MTLINPLAAANTLIPAAATINLRENREQNLRNDQVIRATVAEGGMERALLQLGQRKFWVETETPLATGQKLALQIFEESGEIELRILSTSLSDRVRHVLHLAGRQFDLLPLLQELTDHNNLLFQELSPSAQNALQGALLFFNGQTEGSDGRFLKSMIRVLGLDFEQRLGKENDSQVLSNLKGASLELLSRLAGQEGPLADRIRHLHQMIEASQIFRARLAEDGLFFLPLPLPFLDYGYLIAERHPKQLKNNTSSGGKISLYLQLSSLGCLTIDLLFDQHGLTLKLTTENRKILDFLANQSTDLEQALQLFKLTRINFCCEASKPQQHLVNLLTAGSSTVFDTRA